MRNITYLLGTGLQSKSNSDNLLALKARKHGFARPGKRLVVTAGVPVGQPGTANLLKIVDIENA